MLETEEQSERTVFEEVHAMVQKQENMGYRVRVIEIPPSMYKKLTRLYDYSFCDIRLFGCDVRVNEEIDEPQPGVKYCHP